MRGTFSHLGHRRMERVEREQEPDSEVGKEGRKSCRSRQRGAKEQRIFPAGWESFYSKRANFRVIYNTNTTNYQHKSNKSKSNKKGLDEDHNRHRKHNLLFIYCHDDFCNMSEETAQSGSKRARFRRCQREVRSDRRWMEARPGERETEGEASGKHIQFQLRLS